MTETTYGQYGTNGTHAAEPGQLDPLDRPPVADLAALDPGQLDQRGARIPFGERWNQTLLPSVAAAVLADLAARNPALFGDLLNAAMTGYRRTPTTRKRNKP